MRRWMLCVIASVATIVLGMPGAALAGGGCHGGVTRNDATDQKGATVKMIDACFTATVTTVDPGTPVTFANTDLGVTHNVGGNQWGHFDDMIEGDAFTVTFAEAGIYPFACTYHQGMTGAIVVGDGRGAGSGEAITVQPVEAMSPKVVRPAVAQEGGLPIGAVVAIALAGLSSGAAAMFVIGRRRRTIAAA